MSSGVTVSFVTPSGPTGFSGGYQRNNKTGGQKHLRCFPHCNVKHNNTGFCGSSVVVDVLHPDSMISGSFFAFGAFRCSDDPNEPVNVTIGKIRANANSGEAPLCPWYVGKGTVNSNNGLSFEFNAERRGWHYGWFATKTTREMFHNFKVYVFYTAESAPNDMSSLELVAETTSNPFQLCCTKRAKPDPSRRKRKSSDTLAPSFAQSYDENAFETSSSSSQISFTAGTSDAPMSSSLPKRSSSSFIANKISSVKGGSPALKFTGTYDLSESGGPSSSKRMKKLETLREGSALDLGNFFENPFSSVSSFGLDGGSPDHPLSASSATSPEHVTSPEHDSDIGSESITYSMLDHPSFISSIHHPLPLDDFPVDHAHGYHMGGDLTSDDFTNMWREKELFAAPDHSGLYIPPDLSWSTDRAVANHPFYFNGGRNPNLPPPPEAPLSGSITPSAGIPSAPSMHRLPSDKKSQLPSTQPSFSMLQKILRFFGGSSRNEGEDSSAKGNSKIEYSTGYYNHHGGGSSLQHQAFTPFSSPSLIRPIRSGIASVPATYAYPVPPPALYESLLRASNSSGSLESRGDSSSFSSGRSKRAGSSSSKSKSTFADLFSPVRMLLLILSVAVGYLVVDKYNNVSGQSPGSGSADNVATPVPDSGGGLRTTPSSSSGNIEGDIPSWLLAEFTDKRCQCGSFVALQEFCKVHECSDNLLNSRLTLSTDMITGNQYEMVKWIIVNRSCLKDACTTTKDVNVCVASGETGGPSDAPNAATTTTSANGSISLPNPQWSSSYCDNVAWQGYTGNVLQPFDKPRYESTTTAAPTPKNLR